MTPRALARIVALKVAESAKAFETLMDSWDPPSGEEAMPLPPRGVEPAAEASASGGGGGGGNGWGATLADTPASGSFGGGSGCSDGGAAAGTSGRGGEGSEGGAGRHPDGEVVGGGPGGSPEALWPPGSDGGGGRPPDPRWGGGGRRSTHHPALPSGGGEGPSSPAANHDDDLEEDATSEDSSEEPRGGAHPHQQQLNPQSVHGKLPPLLLRLPGAARSLAVPELERLGPREAVSSPFLTSVSHLHDSAAAAPPADASVSTLSPAKKWMYRAAPDEVKRGKPEEGGEEGAEGGREGCRDVRSQLSGWISPSSS